MKKRFRIVIVVFSLSVVLMTALSFYSLNRFSELTVYSESVDHTNKVITQLYKLEVIVKDLDRFERGYMLTKDTFYQNNLLKTIVKINPAIDTLRLLIADNETQKRNVVLVRSSLALRQSYLRDNFAYMDTARTNEISPFYQLGRTSMRECVRTIHVMQAQEDSLMLQRKENKARYQEITSTSLKYVLGSFCFITIICFYLVLVELRKRMAYQKELQGKIIDLKHSHAELEQIAYAASHDLQEPLRKIQVFSNRLVWLKNADIDEDSKHTMERISTAAVRMQELIDDLVNVTSLTKVHHEKEPVNLNKTLAVVLNDLEEKIIEKKAVIHVETLPNILGYEGQLRILFKALLDNALKFTRDEVQPTINISVQVVQVDGAKDHVSHHPQKQYYRIDIADNGIGFDNKFAHKLFQMFQRLHSEQSGYSGKGIGLTVSQRIMANHNGYIEASGHPKTGATFKLFFPVEE